jgi:LysR family glycine cleavage system transcriptional activator
MPSRKIPSLNWLRVFEVAARTQSFKTTGSLLNMTASAVSQQIRALEGHLDRRLFERNNTSVRLTEFGHLYFREIQGPLSTIQSATDILLGSEQTEQLIIEAPTVLLNGWLVPRLRAFLVANPKVRLNLIVNESSVTKGREGSDVLFMHDNPGGRSREITPLFSEVLCPVAAPEIASRVRHPKDLLRERLIDVKGYRVPWRVAFDQFGIGIEDLQNLRITPVSHTVVAFAMAGEGLGVALARHPSTDGLTKLYGLETCPPGATIQESTSYFMAINPPDYRSNIVDRFKDWVLAEAERDA